MNEDGARFLVTAILKLAHEDYVEGKLENIAESNAINDTASDARGFLHGKWCRDLCDIINVDYEKFVETTINKSRLAKPVFKYIETEIRDYHKSIIKIEQLKLDLIEETNKKENMGGRNGAVGKPTEAKAIAIVSDLEINRLESIVKAISDVYEASDARKKEMVKLKYWQRIYMDTGIANALQISPQTFYLWKKEFVLKIAVKLGYL